MNTLLSKIRLQYAKYGLLILLFVSQISLAQTTVSGKVTSTDSPSGLPGVTLLLKGTLQGVSTDVDGNYEIGVPNESTVLVFSSIGYETQEIVVGNRSVVNLSMEISLTALEEIVVVGYGTQKKSDVTGAMGSIDEKSLREMPAVTNASQLLQSRVSGVDVTSTGNGPGSTPSVLIRGKRSFSAGNDPLFVIDGIPVTPDVINLINPSDIVSMDVLKDASSTAIYGSRGANGVIIVTTKRGKAGEVKVNYNASYGIQTRMKKLDLYNGKEFAEYKRESRRSIGQYDDSDPLADSKLFYPIELAAIQSGSETDYLDLVNQDGYIHNENLSVSGGTESTRINISFGLLDNKGIIPTQKFTRYTTRINLDQTIKKRVRLGMSSLATYSLSNALDVNPMGWATSENPLGSPYDANGALVLQNTPGDGVRTNALLDLDPANRLNRGKSLRLFNSMYGEVDIIKGLKYRMNFGPDMTYNSLGNFNGSQTTASAGGPASAQLSKGFVFNSTWENILTYGTKIGSHRIDVTGLYSRQSRTSENFGSSVIGLPVDAFEYYNMGAASQYNSISSSYEKWGIESYMARINYVFNDRYLLTLTGRADGSSKFAEQNKWGYFPSAAVAWNITNESFFTPNNVVSSLRLRASYGATGNSGISPYQTQGLLTRTAYLYGTTQAYGYRPASIRNNSLRWESTASLNFGLDYDLFQGRISGSLEVYQSNTTDLLLPRLLPNTSGFSSILANVGATRNTGIELMVSSINIPAKTSGGFSWSTDFNITHAREQIVSLSQGKVDDVGNRRFIGQPLNVYYDFERVGIWQLGDDAAAAKAANSGVGYIKVADRDGDGKITPDDRTILGSDVPNFIAGMTNRFTYKGFDLSIVAYARVGQVINDVRYGSNRFGSGRNNSLDVDYWTPTNPVNRYPWPNTSLETPFYGTTLGYFDGSFLKIRNINLGYNLPKVVTDGMGLQSFNVYVSVQNPIFISSYISKYGGIDPEFTSQSTPVNRTFLIGLNINF